MKILVDLAKIIGLLIVIVAMVPVLMTAAAYIGYFYGIILSWLAGGILSGWFGIESQIIPKVIAWVSVVAVILNVTGVFGGRDDE
jgi:hypothetical protein